MCCQAVGAAGTVCCHAKDERLTHWTGTLRERRYMYLWVSEPLVCADRVEDVAARQHAQSIAVAKVLQADRALGGVVSRLVRARLIAAAAAFPAANDEALVAIFGTLRAPTVFTSSLFDAVAELWQGVELSVDLCQSVHCHLTLLIPLPAFCKQDHKQSGDDGK